MTPVVAAALHVLRPGARDRDGRRDESRRRGGLERRDGARDRRPRRCRPSASTSSRQLGVGDVRAVHAGRERHARHRAARRRRAARSTTPSTSSCRPKAPVRIIIAERPGAPRDASLYLSRALALGDVAAVRRRTPSDRRRDDRRSQRASVVILNDVPVRAADRRTARRVRRRAAAACSSRSASGRRGPADRRGGHAARRRSAQPVDRTQGPAARLGALEYGHPVFEPFRAPRSGDFSGARFYGYRAVTPAAGAQILARFDDGAPALLERRIGGGRVLRVDVHARSAAGTTSRSSPCSCRSCTAWSTTLAVVHASGARG